MRKLLLLIPTDPEVQDALDNFVPKESSVWSHQVPNDSSDKNSVLQPFLEEALWKIALGFGHSVMSSHGKSTLFSFDSCCFFVFCRKHSSLWAKDQALAHRL